MSTTRGVEPLVVTGPITGGAHGWPFAAAVDDLAAIGYVEEEFFLAGRAPRYRPTAPLGADGRWPVEVAGHEAFRTRVLVQRPSDPARFNGTVVVAWNNVTAGFELLADVSSALDQGFAFACVSAQSVGIDGVGQRPLGLRAWDPERYGELSHPGDVYSYGIFTEAAQAFGPARTPGAPDPLRGLAVERLLALGASQSAGRLATYVNAVQPVVGVFDGFLLLVHFGSGTALEADDVFDATAPAPPPIFRNRTRLRDDLSVPVMVVNSETETMAYLGSRQPDTDLFRFWEVAGASHGPRPQVERRAVKLTRDGLTQPPRAGGPPSEIAYAPVAGAAMAHLQRWMTGGPPPPSQAPITVTGDPPTIERDEHRNARGGVRLPQIEVPIAHNTGLSPVPGLGGLGGHSEPFDATTLAALYSNRQVFAERFAVAARASVEAGVLSAADADLLVAEAARAPIPATG
ncbi:MAG TPA: alpha/beta hydrolase domain-containing protein [Acidimicrobiales bacterium]|nr:alpha/beta hydrolase domain-containing protein [Acidimicrobiales bacterium]